MFEFLFILASLCTVAVFLKSYIDKSRELAVYLENDLSKHDGWSFFKTQSLIEDVNNGHDLERISEHLHQSQASVRSKLVKMKLYDEFLEHQVDIGEEKFEEWKKLRRKIGKASPITDDKQIETSKKIFPLNWRFVQSLSEHWFDPRLEFCENFYTSTVTKSPDPFTQHEVIKHVAAFLNTAGGHVLVGFGSNGKLLGLLNDDMRTLHHYQNRLEEAFRKALGANAFPFIKVSMMRWGSEDLCLIICEKSEYDVVCVQQKYNEIAGLQKGQKLIYRRVNAQSVHDVLLVS